MNYTSDRVKRKGKRMAGNKTDDTDKNVKKIKKWWFNINICKTFVYLWFFCTFLLFLKFSKI